MRRTHTLCIAGPHPCRLVLSLPLDAMLTIGCLPAAKSLLCGGVSAAEKGRQMGG